MPPGLTRDAAWVSREYGTEKWPDILHKIGELSDRGERMLSRVVNLLKRYEREQPGLAPCDSVVGGKRLDLPSAYAWEGTYSMIADAVVNACTEETDAIIELGSGWGRNLLEVWLRGAPREAKYYACEFTQAGRECSRALANLAQDLDLTALSFDWYKPDFAAVARPLRHAVVFSASSIEQIPALPPAAYRSLFDLAPRLDVLHFEPVGWQMGDAKIEPEVRRRQAEYAETHDYNRNFWAMIEELVASRTIEMIKVDADLVGINPAHPMSLVWWRRDCR